ncbi:MAG TPA: thioredoxin family protein [Acidobacteriota bacterium]|nr:thioredoxin family protein [Acidobacteriota bacterium]
MTKIQILGPGCARCVRLYEAAQEAARDLGLQCEFEKVTDIQRITSFGVMMTPALVVDGDIKVSGKVPSVEEIKKILAPA